MVTVYYSLAYTGAGYAFPTTRKSKWIADSLAQDPIPGITLAEPAPLNEQDILKTHAIEYVRAIQTGEPRELAESQELGWDAGLWPMVLASNGGLVAAALHAMQEGVTGSLSSGLHHARRERGNGYCTFNGLVIAARAALAAGAGEVLILDLDAHCGGGTSSLIADDIHIWQADVAVNDFDSYAPSPRLTLDRVVRAEDYLPTIAQSLQRSEAHPYGLCLYNAGMDPHEDCPIGALAGITDQILLERERLVFDWCRRRSLPVAFVMAGGYVQPPRMDEARLVSLHRLTLAAAAQS